MRAAAIIPARDEREGLERTLAALPMERLTEVVVVDNGSSDGTGEVARRFGATVVPEPRRGYGRACLAGIARLAEAPEEERPEVVVFLDADGSDDPTELDALLAPLRRSYADSAERRPAAARPDAGTAPFAGPRPASPASAVVPDGGEPPVADDDGASPAEPDAGTAAESEAAPDAGAETASEEEPAEEPEAGTAAEAETKPSGGPAPRTAPTPESPAPPTGTATGEAPESAGEPRPETRAMSEESGEPLPALPLPADRAFDASAPLGPGPEGGGAIGFDLVIGSRTRGEMEPGAHPVHARWGNRFAAALIRLLYGYRFTDLGPFRAIRWQTLLALGMRDPDYGWTAEMQVKSARARVCAAEVPVSCRRRIGRSKISGTFGGSLLAGLKILLTVVAPPASPKPPSPTADDEPTADDRATAGDDGSDSSDDGGGNDNGDEAAPTA